MGKWNKNAPKAAKERVRLTPAAVGVDTELTVSFFLISYYSCYFLFRGDYANRLEHRSSWTAGKEHPQTFEGRKEFSSPLAPSPGICSLQIILHKGEQETVSDVGKWNRAPFPMLCYQNSLFTRWILIPKYINILIYSWKFNWKPQWISWFLSWLMWKNPSRDGMDCPNDLSENNKAEDKNLLLSVEV